MLTVYLGSTATLTATLKDAAGVAVTGATVTLTIRNDAGTAIVTGASMADAGAGAYTYTITSNLLPLATFAYQAQVTAVKSGATRYAMVGILVVTDTG